jgi:hypothetical protein
MEPTTSEYIEVRDSSIHNKGVFAAKDIPKGTKIIEYVGEKVTKAESSRRVTKTIDDADHENGAVYIFELNKRHDIDGNFPYNTARLINHSCEPNSEVDIIKGHIWIIAQRKIEKGEEINYNYGYDFEDWEDHPCRCGAKNCIGYILAEDEWPKLRRVLTRRRNAAKKKQQQK